MPVIDDLAATLASEPQQLRGHFSPSRHARSFAARGSIFLSLPQLQAIQRPIEDAGSDSGRRLGSLERRADRKPRARQRRNSRATSRKTWNVATARRTAGERFDGRARPRRPARGIAPLNATSKAWPERWNADHLLPPGSSPDEQLPRKPVNRPVSICSAPTNDSASSRSSSPLAPTCSTRRPSRARSPAADRGRQPGERFPEVKIGLTGLPIMEDDEMHASQSVDAVGQHHLDDWRGVLVRRRLRRHSPRAAGQRDSDHRHGLVVRLRDGQRRPSEYPQRDVHRHADRHRHRLRRLLLPSLFAVAQRVRHVRGGADGNVALRRAGDRHRRRHHVDLVFRGGLHDASWAWRSWA